MTVGQLKEMLNGVDDKRRVVIDVKVEGTQDEDYEVSQSYEDVIKVVDVGYNLIAIEIEMIYS